MADQCDMRNSMCQCAPNHVYLQKYGVIMFLRKMENRILDFVTRILYLNGFLTQINRCRSMYKYGVIMCFCSDVFIVRNISYNFLQYFLSTQNCHMLLFFMLQKKKHFICFISSLSIYPSISLFQMSTITEDLNKNSTNVSVSNIPGKPTITTDAPPSQHRPVLV